MNHTKIEWALNPDGTPGYTWNPVTGCLNGCEYCYAKKLANTRLELRYLANHNVAVSDIKSEEYADAISDPFYPRFWPDRLGQIKRPDAPSSWAANNASYTIHPEFLPENRHAKRKAKGIFTCDMSDLFGIGVPEEWTRKVLSAISQYGLETDRFYLLTKQPQNLIKYSPFPDNCWVGVTATNATTLYDACNHLSKIDAKIKYISIEPLLDWGPPDISNIVRWLQLGRFVGKGGINQLIIGAVTGTKSEIFELCKRKLYYPNLKPMPYGKKWTAQPEIEWVREIAVAADEADIPVFLKNNLRPLLVTKRGEWEEMPAWAWNGGLRQEMLE